MEPGRRYLCAGCRQPVLICRDCDRGQRYCGAGCAEAARCVSMREAGARSQASHRGRLAHAERQRRYRARCNKVTHQGSEPEPPSAELAAMSAVRETSRCSCHFCGRQLPERVRLDFLRTPVRSTSPMQRARHAYYPRP